MDHLNIAATLRQAAYLLANNGEKAAPIDYEQQVRPGHSHYICDILCYLPHGGLASRFLCELGMGCGFGVFGPASYGAGTTFSLETQHQRMAWLFFAADLAEEMGVDWVAVGLNSLSWNDWVLELDKLAGDMGCTPNSEYADALHRTWRPHYDNGLTPRQAWDATPWSRR